MRPRAEASLLARLTASVAARIVKRLDNAPRSADDWAWNELSVTTDTGEAVTLSPNEGVVSQPSQLQCTCLLSPRCFHVLAVVAALETEEQSSVVTAENNEAPPPSSASILVDSAQLHIAERAEAVLGDWLMVGSAGAGAVLQGELLRVVHEARIAGAHRLASAALRVVRGARSLRAERPDFSAAAQLDDLRNLGLSALCLATRSEVSAAILGSARREYTPVGSLRLYGVGAEPVIARGGNAGVVSYVCDERGTLYTLNDVMPGDPSRARRAYELAVSIGDTSVSHRELTRAGLFVQDAAASEDRRLSAGKNVKAVRAGTSPRFDGPELGPLFVTPFDAQLDRAFAALRTEDALLPRSATLVFVRARVLGASQGTLVVSVNDQRLRVVPGDEHPSLPFRENLRLLSELRGRDLLLVGHVMPEQPRTLSAVTLEAGTDALTLPEAFSQRVNLGLDSLQRHQLVLPERATFDFDATPALDPLAALRRRLVALALNGVHSLPSEAARHIDSERSALQKQVMPAAADALGALAESCFRARQERRSAGISLARAFVAATSYERVATLCLRRATFTRN